MKKKKWVFEPRDFLRYLHAVEHVPVAQTRLPARGAFTFGGRDWEYLRKAFHAKRLRWNPWIAVGRAGRYRVCVLRSSIGAPAAVTTLEEAIALGVRDVLSFGACGSLVDGLRIGSPVLPTRAFADEGTSKHYGGGAWFRPSPALVHSLRSSARRSQLPLTDGGVWTTDAPYREGRARARSLARKGVVGVEMEASAMYAVARHRGARIASLFVVSDELGGEEWNAGFRHPAFRNGKRRALRVVIDALSRESP
jgi:purine-nucleoside phosphorylase